LAPNPPAGVHVDRQGANMTRTSRLALAFLFLAAAAMADAQTRDGISRGELLYTTHCIACHSTQVHWRNRKVVKNWPGLQAEIDRWQKASGLGWSDTDVVEVARYLNTKHYRFVVPPVSTLQQGSPSS